MEYAIFPMKTISISNRYSESHKAWDLTGEDSGIDYWYAPCRVKVLAINPVAGFYNTVLFGSSDTNGNPIPVMCEDGVARVLTFACTHMNSLDKFGLEIGKIYQSGERCYCEGMYGNASGNHVHMDVAEGWQYRKEKVNGQWSLPNLTNIANVFYRLEEWNVVGHHGMNGYTFKTVQTRTVDATVTGYAIKSMVSNLAILTEPVIGTNIITVPKATELHIIRFVPGFKSDGYQWAYVVYQNKKGYVRIDTHGVSNIVQTDNSMTSPFTG